MLVEDLIGAGVTNNIQLDKLGKTLFVNNYLGTFSSDNFPPVVRNEKSFIMNNKSSRSSGEHFIAFYKRNGKLYAYDSFSRPVKSLSKYWKNKNIVNSNTNRDQSYKEKSCGSRSMAWLISFNKWGHKVIDII